MSVIDLYDYATSIGLSPADLAAEGITPGSQTITLPNSVPGTPITPSPTTVGGLTPAGLSGQAIILATLRQYGLDTPELTDWAKQAIANGATADQLNLELYDPGSTPGKVVAQLYPELQARQKAGFNPMSIGEVLSYRNTAEQVARAEGYPTELLDFTKLISNNVGLPELQTRIHDNYAAIKAAAPDAVDQLHTLYGLTPGEVAALASDPAETSAHLMRRFDAAQIAAAGVRSSFGQIGAGTAEGLAARGVTADQAQQGFGQLAQLRPLFTALPGEAGGGISEDQQLAAQFGGDTAAQRLIDEERRRRLAEFGGGGGFGAGQRGVSGLGSAAG